MECCRDGVMELWHLPALHYSNIPSLRSFPTPFFISRPDRSTPESARSAPASTAESCPCYRAVACIRLHRQRGRHCGPEYSPHCPQAAPLFHPRRLLTRLEGCPTAVCLSA